MAAQLQYPHGHWPQEASRGPLDLEEIDRKLREEVTPGPDDVMEVDKMESYRDYNKLIEMGGRPTRPIREQPTWETTLVNGVVYYRDPHDKRLGGSVEEDLYIHSHWQDEFRRCQEELEHWQEYLKYRQILTKYGTRNIDLDTSAADQTLRESLIKLDDWQKFRLFQQKFIDRIMRAQDRCLLAFKKLQSPQRPTSSMQRSRLEHCLEKVSERQIELEKAKTTLAWIKEQYTVLLTEILANTKPRLCSELVEKTKNQAAMTRLELERLGGGPIRPLISPVMSAGHMECLHHWTSETSFFNEQLASWKIFVDWQEKLRAADFVTREQEQLLDRCLPLHAVDDDLIKFRREELDKARSWVELWEQEMTKSKARGKFFADKDEMYSCDLEMEDAARNLRQAREDVAHAIARLQDSLKKRAGMLWECNSGEGESAATENSLQQLPPSPPRTASVSPESRPSEGYVIKFTTNLIADVNGFKSKKRTFDNMLDFSGQIEESKVVSKKQRRSNENHEEQKIANMLLPSFPNPQTSRPSRCPPVLQPDFVGSGSSNSTVNMHLLHQPPPALEMVEETDSKLKVIVPFATGIHTNETSAESSVEPAIKDDSHLAPEFIVSTTLVTPRSNSLGRKKVQSQGHLGGSGSTSTRTESTVLLPDSLADPYRISVDSTPSSPSMVRSKDLRMARAKIYNQLDQPIVTKTSKVMKSRCKKPAENTDIITEPQARAIFDEAIASCKKRFSDMEQRNKQQARLMNFKKVVTNILIKQQARHHKFVETQEKFQSSEQNTQAYYGKVPEQPTWMYQLMQRDLREILNIVYRESQTLPSSLENASGKISLQKQDLTKRDSKTSKRSAVRNLRSTDIKLRRSERLRKKAKSSQ